MIANALNLLFPDWNNPNNSSQDSSHGLENSQGLDSSNHSSSSPSGKVRFDSMVKVVLIPQTQEYKDANLAKSLWYTGKGKDSELAKIKATHLFEMRCYIKHETNAGRFPDKLDKIILKKIEQELANVQIGEEERRRYFESSHNLLYKGVMVELTQKPSLFQGNDTLPSPTSVSSFALEEID